jgi:tRNA threonylcarbamoyladenosine biosynthesis protein TsaB
LAFGAALPVVPVVTLAAMALACRQRSGADEAVNELANELANEGVTEVLAVLDARMGEVYWAHYAVDAAGGCQILVAPTLSAPAEVRLSGAMVAGGNGLAAYPDAFEGWACAMRPDIMPHAIEIGQLARIAFRAGAVLSAAQAQPLYLRNKIAYTSAERQAMRAAQDGS